MLLEQLRGFRALQGKRLLAFSMFSCGFTLNEPFQPQYKMQVHNIEPINGLYLIPKQLGGTKELKYELHINKYSEMAVVLQCRIGSKNRVKLNNAAAVVPHSKAQDGFQPLWQCTQQPLAAAWQEISSASLVQRFKKKRGEVLGRHKERREQRRRKQERI